MKELERKIIKLKINSHSDRDTLVGILANNGYKVWVEERDHRYNKIYYVCIEEEDKWQFHKK